MKILPIPFVIVLLVLTGRGFDANAQTETNLYSFVGSPNDGRYPYAALVQGSDGNFYGTTAGGGNGPCPGGCGTVFRVSPSGAYTTLYSFVGYPTDGQSPNAGLVQGSDSNFYGTTVEGGSGNCIVNGCGTIFRISPSGNETNLYSFESSSTHDGFYPSAGLVQGRDGNFYGTTAGGGTDGAGTVFRISAGGTYTTLYSFVSYPTDGAGPSGALVQGSDGNFYGTTSSGGTNSEEGGAVFRISPSGSETNLYSFPGSLNDGVTPEGGLVPGSDGNFYGTTYSGGMYSSGTVFQITRSGSETYLYAFGGVASDGANPIAGLVQGSDGNFYGTTQFGGTNACQCGTVFRISTNAFYTRLYSFVGSPNDGANPQAGLVQGSDGNFYGTTEKGGTNNDGTVFRFFVPLNPPANQISRIGLVGTNVVLAIPSVAGETYQLQFTTNLTSGIWSSIPGVSVTNSIGSILTLTNFAGANQPRGFYRFAITP